MATVPTRIDVVETLIRLRAAATPAAVAIIRDDGAELTYADLDEQANRIAQVLLAAGIGIGERVAFMGENSAEQLACLFGAAKAGAVTVAVNFRLSPSEVDYILRDARPGILVLGRGYEGLTTTGRTAGVERIVTVVPTEGAEAYAEWVAGGAATDPGLTRDRDATALIMYSSGTTGRPKGVEQAGRGLGMCVHALTDHMNMREGSVALIGGPFFHIGGLALALIALRSGATLLLKRYASPAEMVDILQTYRVSHTGAVPSLIQFMLAEPQARTGDWTALEMFSYGASPIPESVLREATEVFGCGFVQSYGLTESTGVITVLAPDDHFASGDEPARLTSVGRAAAGTQIKIVDTTSLETLPDGHRGEVWIKGDGVMNRYWDNPQATREAIVDGWLRTGDIGSLDSGFLYLHDRLKHTIVSGGENVYPAEVEAVMTEHPGIAQVAVIGVPHAKWGEVPFAVAVHTPSSTASEREIIDWTRERLAHYKVPTTVAFVDELPMNATGKVNKTALRAQFG